MRAARVVLAAVAFGAALPAGGVALGPCARAAIAQEENRAGLVVQFDDDRVEEFCVSFAEDSISGFELLRRSGLDLRVEDFGANGVAVCRIGSVGCDHPTDPCFCACEDPSTDCVLWGYYRIDDSTGAWTFSEVGASSSEVRDGDVDGWRFGPQSPGGGVAPRAADLDGICARGARVAADGARQAVDRGAPTGPAIAGLVVLLAALGWWGARRRARGAGP